VRWATAAAAACSALTASSSRRASRAQPLDEQNAGSRSPGDVTTRNGLLPPHAQAENIGAVADGDVTRMARASSDPGQYLVSQNAQRRMGTMAARRLEDQVADAITRAAIGIREQAGIGHRLEQARRRAFGQAKQLRNFGHRQ
jgi:hypothetical protein